MDRLAVLGGHLTPAVPPSATPAPAAAPLGPPLPVVGPPPFDTAALARHLCTDNYDLRQRLLKFLEVGWGRGESARGRPPVPAPRRAAAGRARRCRVSGSVSATR